MNKENNPPNEDASNYDLDLQFVESLSLDAIKKMLFEER
jgi:hypothetical protein